MGVVTFDTTATEVTDGFTNNIPLIGKLVKEVVYLPGPPEGERRFTNWDVALETVRDELNAGANGRRAGIPLTILLVTDGFPEAERVKKATELANEFKADGATIIVVQVNGALGLELGEVQLKPMLLNIASSPDHILELDEYSDLPIDTFVHKLMTVVDCARVTTPAPTTTPKFSCPSIDFQYTFSDWTNNCDGTQSRKEIEECTATGVMECTAPSSDSSECMEACTCEESSSRDVVSESREAGCCEVPFGYVFGEWSDVCGKDQVRTEVLTCDAAKGCKCTHTRDPVTERRPGKCCDVSHTYTFGEWTKNCDGLETRTEIEGCAATGVNVTVDESDGDDGEGGDDKAAAPLDLIYMLDLTGSMGSWLAEAKKKFTAITDELAPRYAHLEDGLRVGFVGYRDRTDSVRFVVSPPTADFDTVLATINGQSASGGGDFPEDVAGGFNKVSELSLRADATKLLVHIADAPGHTNPDADGHDTSKQLAEFAREGLDYVLFDAARLDAMAAEFAEAYDGAEGRTSKKMRVFKLGRDAGKFEAAVLESVDGASYPKCECSKDTKRVVKTETRESPCCEEIEYVYTFSAWSEECGDDQTRYETESCAAVDGCSCSKRRERKTESRAGPCCAVDHAYAFGGWSDDCGGDQTRMEVRTCAATGVNVTVDESDGDDGEGGDDKASAPLDLIYMLDLTGSMGSWLAEAKKKFTAITDELAPRYAHLEDGLRVGFVGYRDRTDSVRFVVSPPTADFDTVLATINGQSASGGGDFPEDVAGGFNKVSELSLRADATKLLVHIADAPGHTNPDADGHDTSKQLAEFAREGLDYVLFDAASLDAMAAEFAKAYDGATGRKSKKMRVFKLGSDSGKFEESVLESVSGATYTPCGCSMDTLRDVKVETRSGPCCSVDYTYTFSDWTKNCEGIEIRAETETCTATGHEISEGSDDYYGEGGDDKASAPLDLIYMLDLTGSMGSWLAEAKKKFTAITDELAPRYAHLEDGLRVGFVGYRDRTDSVRFVVSPPTADFDTVLATINGQSASGGGDFPEDVAGGFNKVSELSLRADATKLLVHIADAPGHTNPDADGHDTSKQLAEFAREGLDYVLFDAARLDAMAAEFAEAYDGAEGRTSKKMRVFKLGRDAGKFEAAVLDSVEGSTSSACGCDSDSRRVVKTETRESPCCEEIEYVYTFSAWSEECGDDQTRYETESCAAVDGCSCSKRRERKTESRAGPCCAVDHAYAFGGWSDDCGGDQTRMEVRTCAATGVNVTVDESDGDDGEGGDDKASAPLDLIYMLDLTGSMGSWLAEAKKKFTAITDELAPRYAHLEDGLRVGFVGYRDRTDSVRFVVSPPTADFDTVLATINGQSASGGGDFPEDVAGGFNKVSELSLRADATKLLVHIADAPGHTNPDADGHDTSKQLAEFAREGLDYVLFDAASLDAMAAEFAKAYDGATGRKSKKMRVFKLGSDSGKFEESVLESVSGATYTPCGCSMDTLRDVKVETRSGPCCSVDYTYTFSDWTKNCEGIEIRAETETCTATGHEISEGSDDYYGEGGDDKASAPLDLIYMLDLTGSMGSWLAEAKKKFTAITDELAPRYAHLEDGLRVGFVGYRDRTDSVRFVVSPPTADFDTVLATINGQSASGGGDFPEDVAGGFNKVSELSLRADATKLLVHIADAPGHTNPDADGHDTSKQLAEFAREGLDYVLFDAARLDAMAAEFAEAYDGAEGRTSKKMRVFKLGRDAGKFEAAVLDSVEGSTSSACGCDSDSRRVVKTETRESPCCEEIEYVYTFSAWSEECGDDQTRYETESCAAVDGCSCSKRRERKTESRAGPCCAVDHAYAFGGWSDDCGGDQTRMEVRTCAATGVNVTVDESDGDDGEGGDDKASAPLDLIYMLDLTGSMGSWLAEAKKKFTAITDELAPRYAHLEDGLRVGFVGYRDRTDSVRFVVSPPTADFDTVLATINGQSASGGGDFPEDVAGGFNKVSELSLRADATKLLVHIADAPGHTNPDADGHDTSKQLAEFAREGLDYVLFDAASLDAMAAEFAKAYDGATGRKSKKMRVFKLGSDSGKFEESVLESVSGATYTPCGCSMDTLRDVKVETRSGPCCSVDYTYTFSDWTKNCEGIEIRAETETCTATGHEISEGSDDYYGEGGDDKASAPLDLIYMLDLTGSMGSWLAEAKKKFTAITDELAPRYAHLEDGLRVGFVGYRDRTDSVRFVVSPPTADFDTVLATINGQSASGGGDFPEDVAGGFNKVSELSLRADATKLLVHIADAPGHTNPDADGHDTSKQLAEFAREGLDYVLFDAARLDAMAAEFAEAYDGAEGRTSKKMRVFKLGRDAGKFEAAVLDSVEGSTSSACGCDSDSRRDVKTETRESPCCEEIEYVYTFSAWSEECGDDQTRYETESCAAVDGCSCSKRRERKTESRAGPCCAVDHAYAFGGWSDDCGGDQTRMEVRTCAATGVNVTVDESDGDDGEGGDDKASAPLDLIYMLDLTGSMGSWLAEAKKKFTAITDELAPRYAHLEDGLRVGFVGYRDRTDSVRFVVSPPTADFDTVLATINGQSASGGGDFPEDVAGGFNKVSELSLRADATKLLVHIADAPGHTNPDADGHDTSKQLAEFAREGLDYVLFDAASLDAMAAEFAKAYDGATGRKSKKMRVFKLGSDSGKFEESVLESVSGATYTPCGCSMDTLRDVKVETRSGPCCSVGFSYAFGVWSDNCGGTEKRTEIKTCSATGVRECTAPMCNAFTCPEGYLHRANPGSRPGDDRTTCCYKDGVCAGQGVGSECSMGDIGLSLIPNPSFEERSGILLRGSPCPQGMAQPSYNALSLAKDWVQASAGTSDYFVGGTSCASTFSRNKGYFPGVTRIPWLRRMVLHSSAQLEQAP